MGLIPTRRQWRGWRLPSKLTAIGVGATIIFGTVGVLVSIALWLFPRSQPIHINPTTHGPNSPAVVVGANSSAVVTYNIDTADDGPTGPQYAFYYQKMKSPPVDQPANELYEMAFRNITNKPLRRFEFTAHFERPVESVTHDHRRSNVFRTGGDRLSPDGRRYHWRGDELPEDDGWAVFVIRTKPPRPGVRLCTKIFGVAYQGKNRNWKLIHPDPDGILE